MTTNIAVREGSELREKARKYLAGLVRFTEGDLSDLTKLLEEARGEVRVLRIHEEARRYAETLRGNDIDGVAALANVLSTFGEEVERRVRYEYGVSYPEPELRTLATEYLEKDGARVRFPMESDVDTLTGLFVRVRGPVDIAKFQALIEQRVRNEYETTDGPEGSRPWRCAKELEKARRAVRHAVDRMKPEEG